MAAPYTSELARDRSRPTCSSASCATSAVDTQSRRDATRSPSTPGPARARAAARRRAARARAWPTPRSTQRLRDRDLPAGGADGAPVIGLIAHLDTSPDASGRRRRADRPPRLRRRRDRAARGGHAARPGGDARARGRASATTSSPPAATPCSAPTTRLASRRSWRRSRTSSRIPELPRPPLRIAFTPDEEIGEGATLFDLERFGAALAYTIDGSERRRAPGRDVLGAIEVTVTIDGVDVHPG